MLHAQYKVKNNIKPRPTLNLCILSHFVTIWTCGKKTTSLQIISKKNKVPIRAQVETKISKTYFRIV